VLDQVETLKLPPVSLTILVPLLKICTSDDNVSTTVTLFAHLRRMEAPLTQGQLLDILDSAARKERADLAAEAWAYAEKLVIVLPFYVC
jgi:hypothetical protein